MSFKRLLHDIIVAIGPLRTFVSRRRTNKASCTTHPRPHAFSLWSHIDSPDAPPSTSYQPPDPIGSYTTWPMLTDKRYSARHLGPAPQSYIDSLPEDKPFHPKQPLGEITRLFIREGKITPSRSSSLFMFFAQWFTDSVLRTYAGDRRKNTSNHNVDLCQIYGRSEASARLLRSGHRGKLNCQMIKGEAYLDYLGELDANGNWQVKAKYKGLPYTSDESITALFGEGNNPRKLKAYATGLERGNSSVGYVAISTLFMREHNRICDELAAAYPEWDTTAEAFDERLFQTARMINTVILLKLVVEEYINHIGNVKILKLDHRFAERQHWYREPWTAIEFDMLYRWHGLIPDSLRVDDKDYDQSQYRFNNALLEDAGLGTIIDAASHNAAGKISLYNVPAFMAAAEYANIRMGRDFRLQSYNAYRKQFKLPAVRSFMELTGDSGLATELEMLYGHIDKLEFIVGLFAERADGDQLFGKLMSRMVGYDAFTQIYTNPLLSTHVYTANTFSQRGLDIIDSTTSVQDLVNRNIKAGSQILATFDVC